MRSIRILAGSAHPALADAICAHIGVQRTRAELVRFSNENMMFQVLENVREADAFVIQPSCPPVSEGIIEALLMIDALKHASAARVTAVLPYFPYARSDKKDRPRISIAARLMADLLQAAGADRVITMNLHSAQVQGFFRIPVDHLNATPLLCAHLERHRDLRDYVVVAGDVGETKDAGEYARRLRLPMAIIDQRKDGNGERAPPTALIGDVAGRRALIVDDEIASGATIAAAVRVLKDAGCAGIEAAAVHAVLSGRAPERVLEAGVERLVVTDTLPVPAAARLPMLETISVAALLGDAIRAVHHGDSVSSLFT
jgi:ribose-phosphate pyrophosphokinase